MFERCSSLVEITIPESVTSLAGNETSYASCFSQCTSLTRIIIPNSVTTIGGSCFQYCEKLVEIIIGTGITKIGSNAFSQRGIIANRKIVIKATTPPTIYANTFASSYFNATNGCELIVPTANETDYEAATNWSNYADIIEGGAENYV